MGYLSANRNQPRVRSGKPQVYAWLTLHSMRSTTWKSTCKKRQLSISCGGLQATTTKKAWNSNLLICPLTRRRRVSRGVRRCTDPKEDAKKAKQDEAAAVVPDAILGRRQKKKEKTYEYEVKWQFKPMESNCWVEKEILVKMGYIKLVQREDERQAAMAGLMTKQLTQPSVEKHLNDFGVDPESASHTQISQLSGGMKVKVVLAASMWQNPHVLILDEPTNYLDREGLGALVLAIKDYKGGVLIISHNKEFCDGVATEKWIMKGGYLRIEGESVAEEEEKANGNKQLDDVYDGAGNKIDVKKNAVLSDKDKKKAIKDLEKKLKDGKKKKTLTDEEMWELEDKLNELKESLKA